MSYFEDSDNQYKDYSEEGLSSDEKEASEAWEKAQDDIKNLFVKTTQALEEIPGEENPQETAEQIAKKLSEMQDDLTSKLDQYKEQLADLGVNSPGEHELQEMAESLDPESKEAFESTMSTYNSLYSKLKDTLKEKLNLSEEELEKISNDSSSSRDARFSTGNQRLIK